MMGAAASRAVEDVNVTAVLRFIIGLHSHADGEGSIGGHRAPIRLVADRARRLPLHSHQLLDRLLRFEKLVARHQLFKGLDSPFPSSRRPCRWLWLGFSWIGVCPQHRHLHPLSFLFQVLGWPVSRFAIISQSWMNTPVFGSRIGKFIKNTGQWSVKIRKELMIQ